MLLIFLIKKKKKRLKRSWPEPQGLTLSVFCSLCSYMVCWRAAGLLFLE